MPRSFDPIYPRGSTVQHNLTSKPLDPWQTYLFRMQRTGAHHAHRRGRVHASHVFDHNRLIHLGRIIWNGQK